MIGNTAHMALFKNSRKEILLVQRRDNSFWVMPGGHLNKKETFIQAVEREVKEETGFIVKTTKYCAVFKDSKTGIEKRIYEGIIKGGQKRINPEVVDIQWFLTKDLPFPMTIYEKNRIQTVINSPTAHITKPYKINVLTEIINLWSHPLFLAKVLLVEFKNRR